MIFESPMKADEADAHPIKVKAARSRFILLEQLPKHERLLSPLDAKGCA
jgi:hypothetical protein